MLHTHVYAQWRRLGLTLLPVIVIFAGWDLFAIHRHTWRYDPRYLIGVTLPGGLPLEELLFFIVIPVCGLLTYSAVSAIMGKVRRRRLAASGRERR